ncbi:MAG: FAD-dependent oxidoreductase, partial [Planctomycetota bacterium]
MSDNNPASSGQPGGDATRDDRHAFPRLSDAQINRVRPFATEETLEDGALIFEQGERSVDFIVVLSGRVEIIHGPPGDSTENRVVHIHRERGFTGELDLFSDRKILVSGRVMPCESGRPPRVLRVPREQFAKLMTAEPEIGNIVIRAFILRRLGLVDNAQGAVTLIGMPRTEGMLELERFLRRNAHPVRIVRAGDAAREVEGALPAGVTGEDVVEASAAGQLPMAVCPGGDVLRRPSRAQLAECLGVTESPDETRTYDVTVIGAGPAGLAAAVYAASEGLSTLVLESEAPGGQAGSSSRIENYLGFPTGLSGQELAGRAQVQAQKFGARLTVPRRVERLEPCGEGHRGYALHLDAGPVVRTRSVVLACGATWRRLDLENADRFENRGIQFAATSVEADLCEGDEIVVVGGGNSAGQAAVYLSRFAKKVHLLIRGPSPAASMSDYLLRRIEASDAIELCTRSQLTELAGDDWLEEATWTVDGEPITRPTRHVFLMIGAVANTGWLDGTLQLDRNGFVCTGGGVARSHADLAWPLERSPHPLETSLPAVFAAGDVRAGSVKRVASAVGEGSVHILDAHRS